MSLLTNASIALLPNGGKAGKLYSLFPTSGLGDFTVVRALDTATRVNENGLIEVVPANVPRIDFAEGTGCGSLLVEPQRTNRDSNSNSFSGSGANVTTSQESPTLSNNEGNLIQSDGTSTQPRVTKSITYNSEGQVVISVRAKKGNHDKIVLSQQMFTGSSGTEDSFFDLTNGTTPTSGAKIKHLGNGWYQCESAPLTIVSGDLSGLCYIYIARDITNRAWPTAAESNGKNILLYGFQAEEGSYATSYIPTSGATAIRNADVISLSGVPQLLGDSEGTLFVEAKWFDTVNGVGSFSLSDGGTNNRINIYSAIGSVFMEALVGSSISTSVNGGSLLSNIYYKNSFSYKTNDFNLYKDGTIAATDNSGNTFGNGVLTIIRPTVGNTSSPFYGRIKSLLVYQAALDTDASEVLSGYATFNELAINKNYEIV